MSAPAPAIFWPHSEHWSVKIPLKTSHYRMPVMEEKGYVIMKPVDLSGIPATEWENLTYMDWKTDKDAIFTPNSSGCPNLMKYIKSIPANFGRVRIIRLEPQTHNQAIRSVHRDDNNRLNPDDEGWVVRMWIELTDNPDSYMLLYDSDENNLPVKESEARVAMPKGAHFVVDSQRLWHVGVHNGTKSRYAAIISCESSPELDAWIKSKM